jgi:hypothetical protein
MVKHDVAFSFAGENRIFVEHINTVLKLSGFNVFYDNDYAVDLWGSDLTITLPEHYNNSRYVVLFIDEYYLRKMWTFFERQVIIENYLKLKGNNYILPVFLNGFEGKVPGLSGLIGHLSCKTDNPDYLINLLLEKLKS